READLAIVKDGEHDDRDGGEVRIGLEPGEDGPAVDTRHQYIERNQGWLELAGEPQPLFARGGSDDAESVTGQGSLEQVSGSRIVVDDEHEWRPVRSEGRGGSGARLADSVTRDSHLMTRDDRREGHGEGRALAGGALD